MPMPVSSTVAITMGWCGERDEEGGVAGSDDKGSSGDVEGAAGGNADCDDGSCGTAASATSERRTSIVAPMSEYLTALLIRHNRLSVKK